MFDPYIRNSFFRPSYFFFRTSDPFPERLDHIGIVVAAQRRHDEGGDVHAAEEGLQAVLVIPDDGEIDFEQQDPFGGEGAAAADFGGVFGAGDDFAVAVDGGEFTGGAEFDEERGSGGGGGENPPGRRSGSGPIRRDPGKAGCSPMFPGEI